MKAGERYTVALQGFSEFERSALASFFRLAAQRVPVYEQVDYLDRCDFVIADVQEEHELSGLVVQGSASSSGVFDADDSFFGPEVLVAEDSAIARRFMQMRLQELGYSVQLATDGEEAMALLERRALHAGLH